MWFPGDNLWIRVIVRFLEWRHVSSAELSRDIAQLVARSLEGQALDSAAAGAALAAKYPQLGMSADLIGKAIARTASMIELVRKNEAERTAQRNGKAAFNGVAANRREEVEGGEKTAPSPEPSIGWAPTVEHADRSLKPRTSEPPRASRPALAAARRLKYGQLGLFRRAIFRPSS
jgi:hypothetical protein